MNHRRLRLWGADSTFLSIARQIYHIETDYFDGLPLARIAVPMFTSRSIGIGRGVPRRTDSRFGQETLTRNLPETYPKHYL